MSKELRFRALLVGNGKFPSDPQKLHELKGPANDVRLLEDTLTHEQVGLHDPDNVKVMLDHTSHEIVLETNKFFDSATRDDQLLFYYSGHGLLDVFNNLYLCARDTVTNALIPTSISDDRLNAMIKQAATNHVLLIIDCCHSGRFKSGGVPENLKGEGRFVLTSSRPKQLSQDADERDEPSAFTKHLVAGLLSGEVDTNKDGYISINELYDYVLPRLREETRQQPYRIFDKAVAELAIGRTIARTEGKKRRPARKSASLERPILGVSGTSIEILDAEPDEELPEEMIDVFNEGSGELEWTAECSGDWIEIEQQKGFVKVRLSPVPGMNRGRIYIRETNTGQAKRIAVKVKVAERATPPKLNVSDLAVDFGSVSKDAESPHQTLRLVNEGAGDLNAKVLSDARWLRAKMVGDLVELHADTSKQGNFSAKLEIVSDGGHATVPVTLEVEPGPVLSVRPKVVDFRKVEQGTEATKVLNIKNVGQGELKYEVKQSGQFFSAETTDSGLTVTMNTSRPGKNQGSLFISSNGGEQTVAVRGRVVPRAAPPPRPKPARAPAPPQPTYVNIAGQWAYPGGGVQFFGAGPNYQYQGLNAMGIAVEQGTAYVQGSQVTTQGMHIMAGPVTSNLTVIGNTLSGQASAGGITVPVVMQRIG